MTGFELLRALPWKGIGEVLAVVGGLGLLVFAGVQVWIQRRERLDRQRAAFAIAYADLVRLMAKRADWEGADLVQMAASRMLYHDDIASPDSGVVVSNIGGLSVAGLALASHAYALLNQAADSARLLADSQGSQVGAMPARELERHCKATLNEVVLTLEDAMAEIPRELQAIAITNANPQSAAGKGFRKVYLERREEDQVPTTGFWATRTGRILSAIGHALQP